MHTIHHTKHVLRNKRVRKEKDMNMDMDNDQCKNEATHTP